jgi:DNA-binding PadR family transcriptional regulator
VQGLKVLSTLLTAQQDGFGELLAGSEISQKTEVASGTLYPLLMRLEASGILESQWETAAPEKLGRPRRRLYRFTGSGAEFARRALEPFAGLPVRSDLARM